MKTFLKLATAALVCTSVTQANAALSFSQSAAVPGVYAAPVFTTPDPTLAYAATDSLADIRLAPLGSSGGYLAVSTGGAA
ncbi:MAG: hypothetical protein H7Y61_19205, partial [Rhizobiales bacterium]|nr:hypothetical protein [Rhizobacter sp.]